MVLLLQSAAEYVGTLLHSLHVPAAAGRAADFAFEHPVVLGLTALGILLLGRLLIPRR